MRKNPWMVLAGLLIVFAGLFYFLVKRTSAQLFTGGDEMPSVASQNSILKLELEGVILDGKKFLKQLKKYREDDHIKAIVIEVNSPGGVVGPSQEIYEEILRTRNEFSKPVVVVSTGVMASGAYYAAVAADRIVVANGAMVGSIGVIMEFVNLEKLYDWAKVSRYSINTGKFKDSGAEYRAMRPDERALFQDLINDVFKQFKDAVIKGRNLAPEVVAQYADGRVFTGAKSVDLGFSDEVGTVDDAYEVAADLAGLDEFDIFEIPKRRPGILDFVMHGEEDEAHSSVPGFESAIHQSLKKLLRTELAGKPLYLMPGSFE